MEGYWGMGSTVTSHGVTQQVGIGGGGRPGKGDGKGKNEADLLQGGLGERIEDKLEELLQRAEDLLKVNRIAVLAVAHALETHKTVTGDDIEAIIEGRPGTLIDGRPYADPEFDRLAEEYHAQAISAHKGHGDFEIALPMLNGQRRADGGFDPIVVRPDGTYAGPSPWSRPPTVAPVPPVVPPPPPVWPEPVDETNGAADGADDPSTSSPRLYARRDTHTPPSLPPLPSTPTPPAPTPTTPSTGTGRRARGPGPPCND